MRDVRDQYLPPDHDAFVGAEPPTGRVIVIAPTRAACETIELAVGLHIETYLEKHFGARVRELARARRGFGIVAGTGSGKTLAIRPIAEELLGTTELRVGVINREREATPETPTWNIVIVTTGIARRWFQDGDILPQDTLIVDEIHQTSAELELCLALGKRVGCRFIWLSATVDPTFYRNYLNSADVLEVYAFDPEKAAKVEVMRKDVGEFLDDKFLQRIYKEKRGVAIFVPTRKGVEQAAENVRVRAPRINTAHYHGGEPIRILRPFLEGEEQKPYFLAMTAAGQSALNVQGLDTVIIDDTRFTSVVERGKNVLTKLNLGANEILQMAGRVHGRVAGGRVFILSNRDIDFATLKPTAPEFQLAGDSERVAITCADIGVDVGDLELPVPLDRIAYRRAKEFLEGRGIIEEGRLTRYGRLVEAMPVEREWAELLVNADDALVPYLSVMSGIDSLHRMTREERDLEGLVLAGSDHLTAYNVYAEAYRVAGYVGQVYGLDRHLFREEEMTEWAERRGVLVKSIEDTALGMASVYRGLNMRLPSEMPMAHEGTRRQFAQLLAEYMPFDLVIDEQTAWGEEARVSKTSVCGSWGPIAGELRYFADRFGNPRASIEGTQLPMDLIRRYATGDEAVLVYDGERRKAPLVLQRRVEYFGFELEREIEAVEVFPEGREDEARRVLADALARGEARHFSVKDNLGLIDAVREAYRRSGGALPRLGQPELAALYLERLGDITSLTEFKQADLGLAEQLERLSPRAERRKYDDLPTRTTVRDREVEIDYDVEEVDGRPVGVARLRLPEKVARSLTAGEVPVLDRPVRFVVARGQRGSVRARTVDELQTLLDAPWTEEEIARFNRKRDEQREANRQVRGGRGKGPRDAKRPLREEHPRGQRQGKRERSRKPKVEERESYIGVPLPGDMPIPSGHIGLEQAGAPKERGGGSRGPKRGSGFKRSGPKRGPGPGGRGGGGRGRPR
ncbi:MAG: helicase, family [Gemmatimonadetes bacterium]|jgi:ATP-dependent helicase HrpA|nr:helicase, family [Gemmatimonadota bacterium]